MRSKKRSAASSRSTRRPSPGLLPTLFIDRSLGRYAVAEALRAAGATVEVHDAHLPPDAPDQDWLALAGARGWAVLTKDRRVRHRETELAAMQAANVRAFVLTVGDLQGAEMGNIFTRALPAIASFVAQHEAPFIARVARSGKVVLLLSAKQLRRVR